MFFFYSLKIFRLYIKTYIKNYANRESGRAAPGGGEAPAPPRRRLGREAREIPLSR